ncbi:MAG TPA: hypothetical protein VLF68_01300, partial [Candidatus Saccharimonadales bacterium]|nr:hypothetical protein [Candidatus Saccharimonadales bacterium]
MEGAVGVLERPKIENFPVIPKKAEVKPKTVVGEEVLPSEVSRGELLDKAYHDVRGLGGGVLKVFDDARMTPYSATISSEHARIKMAPIEKTIQGKAPQNPTAHDVLLLTQQVIKAGLELSNQVSGRGIQRAVQGSSSDNIAYLTKLQQTLAACETFYREQQAANPHTVRTALGSFLKERMGKSFSHAADREQFGIGAIHTANRNLKEILRQQKRHGKSVDNSAFVLSAAHVPRLEEGAAK